MKNKKETLSLIVPCYNEEEALPIFYNEVTKVLNNIDYDYELILVDDGSKDNTFLVMEKLSKLSNKVKYISFSRNFGKESAMYAGLCNANGDYIGFIDADLQHPPILIVDMLNALKDEKYDCAACKRTDRIGDSKIRTWFARKFYKIINKISDAKMVDGAGDYRIMKRSMADAVISLSEYNRFSKGIFSWVGFETYWIDYENVDRIAGKTSWSFFGLVKYAINGIISFSNAPLDIVSIFGLFTTILSFAYLLFIVIKYSIFGDPVQGWATTICVILIIGGIELFSIGVIGQYIGRVYLEVKDRPHYIVSKTNKENIRKIK